MERRLLHRWYGNVPGDDWPTGVCDHFPLSWRGQNDSPSTTDQQTMAVWKQALCHLLTEEKILEQKLISLDLELSGIPSNKHDRTESDNDDMRGIEAEYAIVQDRIQAIRSDQKHCYTMFRLFGLEGSL